MYRRYLCVLLGLCGALVAYVLFMSIVMQPLVGDLTRVGGFSENEYGWNGAEERFMPPLAEPGRLDRDYPIVVVGDSFSLRTTPDRQTQYGSFWTDFLAAGSGLRVGVFDVGSVRSEDVLASPAYRLHPPRLVILELSERTLKQRLPLETDCTDPGTWIEPRLESTSDPPRPGSFRRNLVTPAIATVVDQLADRLRKDAARLLLGDGATEARRLRLVRADLFTSRHTSELLVYAEDLQKADWTAAGWTGFRCRLLRYQHDVMANGKTSFLFVLAPDKSSAYAQWLPPAPWQVDAARHLADPPGLRMPRVDLALRAAIAAGVRDVYLPDDTHWSTTGSRIVARAVLEYLQPKTDPSAAADVTASR